MSIAQEIQQDLNGIALMRDWLGDGGLPVEPMVAEARAQRCVAGNNGEPCPFNIEPNWWGRVKHVVADWILGELEIKNRMKLKVSCEDHLAMCKVCGCCLKLKVWTPTNHLRKHLEKKELEQTPTYCWMRKELLP